jgi:hypothetical protein
MKLRSDTEVCRGPRLKTELFFSCSFVFGKALT